MPRHFTMGPCNLGYTAGLHLIWIAQRLEQIHGESPDADYMIRLREIADALTASEARIAVQDRDEAKTREYHATKELAEARARIAALEEGLAFYANKENWRHKHRSEVEGSYTDRIAWGKIDLEAPAGHALAAALKDHGSIARSLLPESHNG